MLWTVVHIFWWKVMRYSQPPSTVNGAVEIRILSLGVHPKCQGVYVSALKTLDYVSTWRGMLPNCKEKGDLKIDADMQNVDAAVELLRWIKHAISEGWLANPNNDYTHCLIIFGAHMNIILVIEVKICVLIKLSCRSALIMLIIELIMVNIFWAHNPISLS